MYRPFLSYSLAILCYGLILLASVFFYQNQQTQPKISLQIDAKIFDQIQHGNDHQHEFSKKISKEHNNKAQHHHNHLEGKKPDLVQQKNPDRSNIAKNLAPLYQPLPDIPEELRFEAMRTTALARFNIKSDGNVESVKLITASNSPKLNYLLVKSLKQWRFPPASNNSSQEISITFEVK